MGNNAAFSEFEFYTILMYDKGALDKATLSTIMERYREMDIDHGGMEGTLSKDGLDVEEIVLKVFGKTIPAKPDLPANYKTWTKKQESENEKYWDTRYEAFNKISHGQFGWS